MKDLIAHVRFVMTVLLVVGCLCGWMAQEVYQRQVDASYSISKHSLAYEVVILLAMLEPIDRTSAVQSLMAELEDQTDRGRPWYNAVGDMRVKTLTSILAAPRPINPKSTVIPSVFEGSGLTVTPAEWWPRIHDRLNMLAQWSPLESRISELDEIPEEISIPVPVLNRSVGIGQTQVLLWLAQIALYAYLVSFLIALRSAVSTASESEGLTWVFFHPTLLGPIIGTLWILFPNSALLWLVAVDHTSFSIIPILNEPLSLALASAPVPLSLTAVYLGWSARKKLRHRWSEFSARNVGH